MILNQDNGPILAFYHQFKLIHENPVLRRQLGWWYVYSGLVDFPTQNFLSDSFWEINQKVYFLYYRTYPFYSSQSKTGFHIATQSCCDPKSCPGQSYPKYRQNERVDQIIMKKYF